MMRKTNQISNGVKKLFLPSLIFALVASFFLTNAVFAVELENPLKYKTLEDIVDAITDFLLILAPTLAGVMFIIAGFMFITSAGDPTRTGNARKMMLYTAIGLAFVLLASGLVKVIQSILGVEGT